MKYYLRQHEYGDYGDGIYIIEFDDETKKFNAYIRSTELEVFDMEEIKVEDGKKIFEETEGVIKRTGNKFKKTL